MIDLPDDFDLSVLEATTERRREVFRDALTKLYSYNPLSNPFFWIGFVWGLPIPLLFLWFHHHLDPASLPQLVRKEPVHLIFFLHPFVFGIIFGLTGSVIQHYLERLREESINDYLTGLYNHRFFRRALEERISEAERYDRTFCVVLFDLDHFKQVNDEYGHQVGDTVLEKFAGLLEKFTRDSDLVFRYGGEEFSLILPETDLAEGRKLAERIRAEVAIHDFGIERQITVSGGVAEFPSDSTAGMDLIQVVDERLYEAKGAGRNTVMPADAG